ncbi:MAG: hypothetical protein WA734_14110 [Candidatus Acidiferrales bacterium]
MKKVLHVPLMLAGLLSLTPFVSAQQKQPEQQAGQNKLVEIVRNATAQYIDVNKATAAGYSPLFGCVSGSDHGAMGIHYVNGALLNGTVDATTPQALIYEPSSRGGLQLVGVEFIVDAATWLKTNSAPPVLEGQVFLYVDAPNRFTIPAFFELHVWAWRANPQGSFVDWNDHVSCAGDM